MPFCKRTVLPRDVCKPDARRGLPLPGELADVCGASLGSVLRQLSDLSRHSVSILGELEGELGAVCLRSGALEARAARLQRHVEALLSKPPPRGKESRTRARTTKTQLTWSQVLLFWTPAEIWRRFWLLLLLFFVCKVLMNKCDVRCLVYLLFGKYIKSDLKSSTLVDET